MEAGYELQMCWRDGGEELRLGHRPGRWRLERGVDHAVELDEEGRAVRREAAGESWRFTLDGRVLRSAGPRHARHRLPPLASATAELARETACLRELPETLPENPAVRAWLTRARRFDREGLEADRRRLRQIYQPIPVLPPDQYDALVVQLTEGCPYDRCTFCNFYRGTSHRIRDERAFDTHLDELLSHLGRSVERCSRVFLGQANAMLAPSGLLCRHLDAIVDRLGRVPEDLAPPLRRQWRRSHPTAIDGFYSFVDAFHRLPTVEQLEDFRRRGLRRLYLGLESGSRPVLELLGKPTPEGAVEELVSSLHEADIAIAVIVLLGAGGRTWRQQHETETLRQLERLRLRAGDQLYLSRLVVHDGGEYAERAAAEHIEALDEQELEASARRLRSAARAPVIAADYDLVQISQWSPRI
jgi:hypothetical protein